MIEAVDSGVAVMDNADRSNSAGSKETLNCLDRVVNENITAEDHSGARVIVRCTHATTINGSMHAKSDTEVSVSTEDSAELTDSRNMKTGDHEGNVDQSAEGTNAYESDGDCSTKTNCLVAMTPSGQDHYLRLGNSPRRRSALRLSRIIARRQLLSRLSQGREVNTCLSLSRVLCDQNCCIFVHSKNVCSDEEGFLVTFCVVTGEVFSTGHFPQSFTLQK